MSLIERYAELTAQKKLIETELDEINEKLLAKMIEDQVGSIKADFGTFTKAQKFVYEYPEEFKLEESQVKASLKSSKEEVEKTLTPTIKNYLTFRAK